MKKFTLVDIVTGEIKVIESDGSDWCWAEGNNSCDCNRSRYFGVEVTNPDERGIGTCGGAKRFIVVDNPFGLSLEDINYSYAWADVEKAQAIYKRNPLLGGALPAVVDVSLTDFRLGIEADKGEGDIRYYFQSAFAPGPWHLLDYMGQLALANTRPIAGPWSGRWFYVRRVGVSDRVLRVDRGE